MGRRTFFIIPWYRHGDYPAAVSLFGDLPGSHAAWHDHALQWEEQCRTAAVPCLRVLLQPDEFRTWCRAHHLQPDGEARATFIIAKARTLLWPDTASDHG